MSADRVSRCLAAVYWTLAVVFAFTLGARWRYDEGLRLSAWKNPVFSGQPAYEDLDTRLSNEVIERNPFPLWPTFSIEWQGFLAIDDPGDYAFALDSDDGSTLDLDGTRLVDNDGAHGVKRAEGHRRLAPGLHAIRVRYFQAGEHSSLSVLGGRNGGPLRPLPAARLVPEAMSYTAYRWRWLRPVVVVAVALACAFGVFLGVWPWLRRVGASDAGAALGRLLAALERPAVAVAVIAGAGLVVRLAVLASTPAILWPDSFVFHNTAQAVLAGRWLQHDGYRTFVYPWLLAALMRDGTAPSAGTWLVAWQMAMGVATAVVVYRAALRVVTPLMAFVAALGVALHALQVFYETSVLTESAFTLVLVITVWLAVRLFERPSWTRAALVGVSAALLVLVRPVAQYYVLALVAACLLMRVPFRRRAAVAAVVLACHAVPMLWWMGVNQREFGFFGVALGRGMGLYTRVFDIDHLEPPTPSAQPELRALWAFAISEGWSANRVRDELNYGRRYSAARADDAMFAFAMETVRAHPLAFAANTVRHWIRLVTAPNTGVRSCPSGVGRFLCSGRAEGDALPGFPNAPAAPSTIRAAVVHYVEEWQVPMAPVAALAIAGVVALDVLEPEAFLLLATIVYLTLVPAISQVAQDRFRLPADPLTFVFAAAGATRLSGLAASWVDRVRRAPPGDGPAQRAGVR